MPLLEIDDDVYQYLLRKAIRIGEDGSSILRRELKLLDANGAEDEPSPKSRSTSAENPTIRALTDFLISPRFMTMRNATDRYLALLSFLAVEHGETFEKVLHLRGNHRRYFGRSRDEVARSGRSLHPQEIPGTTFWAMTNADTAQKKDIIAGVMSILRYPRGMVIQAQDAVE